MNHKLSEKWIKASIAGTIWAASEIVLGSFLHNLNIPFSGNILTAIGLIVLISISYTWADRGLFWRAGLICAIMKTMSPSAVIFGPMIAIFSESVLLEISVRLLGRTIPGYAIGAMLAMSWNLFQKIGSYIIYYGPDIIGVYSNLLKMAQKQLDIKTDLVWLPIIILFVVYALFGLVAAIIGIRVGRKMLKEPAVPLTPVNNGKINNPFRNSGPEFNYSVFWLFLNIILIIGSFFLLSYTSWIVWSLSIAAIVIMWSMRYRRALRQLSKPKFWVFFVTITLITAFVFTKTAPGESFWKQGLITGIQMNFRAVIMIVGFSTLGTELYNPVIREFFMKTSFRNLPLAIEIAVESLPDFIAAIPDFKSVMRNPVSIFHSVISHAGERLTEIKKKEKKVFIITGSKTGGKTTFTGKLAGWLYSEKIETRGFLAERIMSDNETTGYDLVNLESGQKTRFLHVEEEESTQKIGRFSIYPDGLVTGKKILESLINTQDNIVIIDEVGRLELNDAGWAENISELIEKSTNHLILIVRDEFVRKVREKWHMKNAVIISIDEISPEEAGKKIIRMIQSKNPELS
jgi:nucleoside-triphosphatase THEP1